MRYIVSADATKIIETRQMHQMILEDNLSKHPEFSFHTHVLSDVPEDSDVFYALTRKAPHGEWIGTRNYFYEIGSTGSLRYMGTVAETVKRLEDGQVQTIDEPYKSMVLSSAKRLLEGTSSANPLEAFTSFAGARCTNKTLWLKFSTTLHNVGEGKVLLYKEPLRNSQARFGASGAEILAGKFEKLAFFAVSPEKVDFSKQDSYMLLSPGMQYNLVREYPILGLDPRDKAAVQFLYITWPLGQEKDVEAWRSHWEGDGYLYADTIESPLTPLTIEPKLLKECAPQ